MAELVEAPDLDDGGDSVVKSVMELLGEHKSREEQEKRAAKLAADVGIIAATATEVQAAIKVARWALWPTLLLLLGGDGRELIEAILDARARSAAPVTIEEPTVARGGS